MKLIDKNDLVVEIERRIKYNHERAYLDKSPSMVGREEEDKDILSIIDTIEVKEVNLNEEIKDYFKGFGMFPSVGIDDCIDIAKHFYKLGLAQKGE